MRNTTVASVVLLGSILAAACSDNPVSNEAALRAGSEPNQAVSAGETFSSILISNPTTPTFSLALGGSKQMSTTLKFSLGGTMPGVPYTSWRSTDACVATVTSESPSWGLVKGLKAGTALIIAEAWGKADTVAVTVSGSDFAPQSCYDADWAWDLTDESFTESPLTATEYKLQGPLAGEKLVQLVLFATPKPDFTLAVGQQLGFPSEFRYDRGGKLRANTYATYSVTDGTVAKVGSAGKITGLKPGRTKVIARLGEFADTVPLYVR